MRRTERSWQILGHGHLLFFPVGLSFYSMISALGEMPMAKMWLL
jgi:hypothetical protein